MRSKRLVETNNIKRTNMAIKAILVDHTWVGFRVARDEQ